MAEYFSPSKARARERMEGSVASREKRSILLRSTMTKRRAAARRARDLTPFRPIKRSLSYAGNESSMILIMGHRSPRRSSSPRSSSTSPIKSRIASHCYPGQRYFARIMGPCLLRLCHPLLPSLSLSISPTLWFVRNSSRDNAPVI